MMQSRLYRQHHRQRRRRRGFTMIEAAISVVIVGVMFASALSMTGTAKMTRYRRALRDRATVLADSLLTEVMSLPYEDPDEATIALGQESGDVAVYNALVANDPDSRTVRRDWADDVDDLDGWNQSPPVHYDGTEMTDLAGWKRKIKIKRLQSSNLRAVSPVESGIKCIEVKVSFKDQIEVVVEGIRSSGR